ncbi:dihydropteroate synthase [Oxyplasma meridianum]|uniref:dihydropteroate synthase n=1 Tax=Oxyplasma meridianum TaxID=3073602 RepID=A0AAX4NHW6_9ARCH
MEIFTEYEMEKADNVGEIGYSKENLHRYVATVSEEELREIFHKEGLFEGYEKDISSMYFSSIEKSGISTKIMGILNITPDSFYPGSRVEGRNMSQVDRMLDEKPDIIDIGGESTRPGSSPVNREKETARIQPVLEYISNCSNIPISIDSRNPETILKCLDFRVNYINDISGFTNRKMIRIASETGLNAIVMHMRGTPDNMQMMAEYEDIVMEINSFLLERISEMISAGVKPHNIIVDPGLGFAKTYQGNIAILRNIDSFRGAFPLLVGTSRKTFLGHITGRDVNGRLAGTIATSVYLAEKHVDIVRVHDVAENRDAIKVTGILSGE